MPKLESEFQPRRILAVKLADLGDSILITPSLRALKRSYPEARLDVLTTNGLPALEGLPYVDRVLTFDKYNFDDPRAAFKPANLIQAVRFFKLLALEKYDVVIFFHHFTLAFGTLKFAALSLATLAPVRVGLDSGRMRSWFLNWKVKDRGFGAVSEREYWLELAAKIGARLPEEDNGKPELFVDEPARNIALEWSQKLGSQPLVAIAPGSGTYSLARRWFPSRFAEVADNLIEKHGVKVVILGNQEEKELAEEVKLLMRHPEQAVVLAGQTNLKETTALLELCVLFIGNDGGPAHFASTVSTPSIIIFGPTNAVAWKPFGSVLSVVQAPLALPCRPCLYKNFELGSRYGCAPRPCLSGISAGQVLDSAEKLLAVRLKREEAGTPRI